MTVEFVFPHPEEEPKATSRRTGPHKGHPRPLELVEGEAPLRFAPQGKGGPIKAVIPVSAKTGIHYTYQLIRTTKIMANITTLKILQNSGCFESGIGSRFA